MVAEIRQKTLRKLIDLDDYMKRRDLMTVTPDLIIKLLHVNRRTAYDYLNALIHLKGSYQNYHYRTDRKERPYLNKEQRAERDTRKAAEWEARKIKYKAERYVQGKSK